MKRWVWMAVLGATAGIILALTSHLFLRDSGKSGAKINETEKVAAIAVKQEAELSRGLKQPAPGDIQDIHELEKLGVKGRDTAATLYAAWLRRMHDNKLGNDQLFRDLANSYVSIEPQATHRAVKALIWEATSAADRDYYKHLLLTFDKAALPALIVGLEIEAASLGNDYQGAANSSVPPLIAKFGEEALPALQKSLQHNDPAVRRQVLRTLARMGDRPEYAADALPDVVAALKNDREPSVKAFAALTLGELVPLAPKEIPADKELVRALEDFDPLVRLAAARTLSRHSLVDKSAVDKKRIASVVTALLKADVFSDDLVQHRKVWWNVTDPQTDVADFAVWKGGLSYNPMFWDEVAAHVLLGLGPAHRLDPKSIVVLLRSCPHDGRHLITMLAAQGERAREVLPELEAMVKDRNSLQRRKALITLGRLGNSIAGDAVPTVIEALEHEDGKTRWQAFLALTQIDPGAARMRMPVTLQRAVDVASGSLKRADLPGVKAWTRCLWNDSAAVLVPVTDDHMGVDSAGIFRTPTDLDAMAEIERIDNVLAVLADVQSLSKDKGPLGKEAVPFLLSIWESTARNPVTRARHGNKALALLAREGAAASPAVPYLIQALHYYDNDEPSKHELNKALAAIGESAVPYLTRALNNPEQADLHFKILGVFQHFGPKARSAVPSLLRALMSTDPEICAKAAETFGYLRGNAAQDAVPELRKLLKWDDSRKALPILTGSSIGILALPASHGSPLAAASSLYPGRYAQTRRHAVDALCYMGPDARDAVPDLIGLFGGDNQELRLVAVRAVSSIGKDAVPLLVEALADPREKVRLSVVQSLSRMTNEDSASAVPVVQTLAGTEQNNDVKEAIKSFLGQ